MHNLQEAQTPVVPAPIISLWSLDLRTSAVSALGMIGESEWKRRGSRLTLIEIISNVFLLLDLDIDLTGPVRDREVPEGRMQNDG